MNEIMQGWALSVVGILVAFTFMAVFIGIMVLLKWLFPYKEEVETGETEVGSSEPAVLVESAQPDEEAVVAAIAAALAVAAARARQAPGIGEGLVAGRGSWWVANRMASRQGVNVVRK